LYVYADSVCALTTSHLSTIIDNDAGISLHPMPVHKSWKTTTAVNKVYKPSFCYRRVLVLEHIHMVAVFFI